MKGIEGRISEGDQTAFRTVGGLSASSFGPAPVMETKPEITVVATEARPGYWLAITYADGCEIIVDLGDVVRRGGAFEPLQDEQQFSRVQVNRRGNSIEWPEPKDEHSEPLISIDAVSIYRAYDQAIAANYRKRTA